MTPLHRTIADVDLYAHTMDPRKLDAIKAKLDAAMRPKPVPGFMRDLFRGLKPK